MASIGEDFTTNGDDVKTVTFPTGGNREGLLDPKVLARAKVQRTQNPIQKSWRTWREILYAA
jgi:hypothetical protein